MPVTASVPMKRFLATCLVLALAGCAPADGAPSSTSTSGGSTGSGTATPQAVIHASFVAEQEAGAAPALLRMFNDTEDQILSLTLADGRPFTFYLVEPRTATDHEITVSADMWQDAVLSIHTLDTCVRRRFSEMTGPLVLEPGHAYAIHVTVGDGFIASIEEEPVRAPYVGIRAHVTDPSSSPTPGPSKVLLSAGEAVDGEIVFDTIFTEVPEPYVLVPSSKITLETIRFVDRSGTAHESTAPVVLGGSHGYTVYVADEAREGAALDVPLDDLAQ
jgi:hypothetical protein